MHFTLAELAERVGGRVEGDGSLRIERVMPLEEAGPADISFFSNRKYLARFASSRAGAVIVGEEEKVEPGRSLLRAGNAYLAFAKVSTLFHPPREPVPEVSMVRLISCRPEGFLYLMRYWPGGWPNSRLNARLNAASDS